MSKIVFDKLLHGLIGGIGGISGYLLAKYIDEEPKPIYKDNMDTFYKNINNSSFYKNTKLRQQNLDIIAELVEKSMTEMPYSVDYDREINFICDKLKTRLHDRSKIWLEEEETKHAIETKE